MFPVANLSVLRQLLFSATVIIGVANAPALYAGGVTFEDVTAAAGLNAVHSSPSDPLGPFYCREEVRFAAGAAALDANGDGWTDLFVTQMDAPNRLYINNADGTFTDVAASVGLDLIAGCSGVACGDVDNDGDIDIYVTAITGVRNYLFVNDGTGDFSEVAIDRRVDLMSPGNRNTGATFGDYDNDGDLDLHTLEWTSFQANNRLFQNDGAGSFVDVTVDAGVLMSSVWGFANAFSDIDNDGFVDLLVAADFGSSRLFRNLGNGQFQNLTFVAGVATDENGMGSTIGDYDGDGDLDWFVTSIFDADETCEVAACNWGYTGNRLYQNETGTTFSDATDVAGVRDGGWGWGTSFLDYDNDGDLDLAMTNGVIFPCDVDEDPYNTDPLKFWENDGAGNMTEVSNIVQFTDTRSGKGFVVFDYDNDGDLDVFIANNGDTPILFRNNGGNTNDWLRVNAIGETTNRMGLGARVKVRVNPEDPFQLREVHAHNNYMSQNETTVHFGVGSGVSSIDLVRVEWPLTGFVQEFRNVSPNTTITVQEGNSIDLDGTVDAGDASAVNACIFQSAPGDIPIGCGFADLNADGNVDCLDWQMVQSLWTEAEPIPENFACDGTVPTTSEWGLVFISLSLLTAGTIVFRRHSCTISQSL